MHSLPATLESSPAAGRSQTPGGGCDPIRLRTGKRTDHGDHHTYGTDRRLPIFERHEETVVIAVVIGCLTSAAGIYFAIVAWPQRIPKDRTVAAIQRRVDSEHATHHPRGNTHGR